MEIKSGEIILVPSEENCGDVSCIKRTLGENNELQYTVDVKKAAERQEPLLLEINTNVPGLTGIAYGNPTSLLLK